MLKIAAKFRFQGKPRQYKQYGSGLVNKTYRVTCESGKKYILQKVNTQAFLDPISLMENIDQVTRYLHARVRTSREALSLVPAVDGNIYALDEEGGFWRAYDYITGTICLEKAGHAGDFYQSGLAFGRFLNLLTHYPTHTLVETIPGFHDTPLRYRALKDALALDAQGRAEEAREEIDFALLREAGASVFMKLLQKGRLPLRVTHNDTKLNNILFDRETRRSLCVVDLDTVMPGLVMNDFGDAIRFGASSAAEDETELSRVQLDLELYAAFTRGFIESCGDNLTKKEVELLPMGAKLMTLECGVRFLTDFLSGDRYFRIEHPGHNLDRCRAQFKLLADMEQKWPQMNEIVMEAAKKLKPLPHP